ncbi:MAG: hypothetical protein QG608_462 [Actinomycetota bacterium]|nr:hypothetical protein [Actinomycetota bacterium]
MIKGVDTVGEMSKDVVLGRVASPRQLATWDLRRATSSRWWQLRVFILTLLRRPLRVRAWGKAALGVVVPRRVGPRPQPVPPHPGARLDGTNGTIVLQPDDDPAPARPTPFAGCVVLAALTGDIATRLGPEVTLRPVDAAGSTAEPGREPSADLLLLQEGALGPDPAWAVDLARRVREAGTPVHLLVTGPVPEPLTGLAEVADRVWTQDASQLPVIEAALPRAAGRTGVLPPAVDPARAFRGRARGALGLGVGAVGLNTPEQVEQALGASVARSTVRLQGFDGRGSGKLAHVPPALKGLSDEDIARAWSYFRVAAVGADAPGKPGKAGRRGKAGKPRTAGEARTSPRSSALLAAERALQASACSVPVFLPEDSPVRTVLPQGAAERIAGPVLDLQGRHRRAASLLTNPELQDREGHRARRAVCREHLWTHRAGALLGREVPQPTVTAVVATMRPQFLDQVIANVAGQTHRPLQLVLVPHGIDVPRADFLAKARDAGLEDVVILPQPSEKTLGAIQNAGIEAADGELVAKMDDDDLYLPEYLADYLDARRLTGAPVLGKMTHYVHFEGTGATTLKLLRAENRWSKFLVGATLLAERDLLRRYGFGDSRQGEDTNLIRRLVDDGVPMWSADRFNFCVMRRNSGGHTWALSLEELLASNGLLVFYGQPHDHVRV